MSRTRKKETAIAAAKSEDLCEWHGMQRTETVRRPRGVVVRNEVT